MRKNENLWTPVLIQRLKKYVETGRYFRVEYRGDEVFGMDIPPDNYPITEAAIYLQEYDDCTPDAFTVVGDTKPDDFVVFLKAPVQWQSEDPNWSIADPDAWGGN